MYAPPPCLLLSVPLFSCSFVPCIPLPVCCFLYTSLLVLLGAAWLSWRAAGVLSGLCDLRVGSNGLGDEASVHLVKALHNCKQLAHLDLREVGCSCYGGAVSAVTELVLQSSHLGCVRLCKNAVLSEGAATIRSELKNLRRPLLMTLNMAMIDEAGAQHLLHLVRKNHLVTLSVLENPMGFAKRSLIQERVESNQSEYPPPMHWWNRLPLTERPASSISPTSSSRTLHTDDQVVTPTGRGEQLELPLSSNSPTSSSKTLHTDDEAVTPTGRPSCVTPRSSPVATFQMSPGTMLSSPQAPPSPFLDAVWGNLDEQQKVDSMCLNNHLIKASWILFCKRAVCLFASRSALLKIRFLRRIFRKNKYSIVSNPMKRLLGREQIRDDERVASDDADPSVMIPQIPQLEFSSTPFATSSFCNGSTSCGNLYAALCATNVATATVVPLPQEVGEPPRQIVSSGESAMQFVRPDNSSHIGNLFRCSPML